MEKDSASNCISVVFPPSGAVPEIAGGSLSDPESSPFSFPDFLSGSVSLLSFLSGSSALPPVPAAASSVAAVASICSTPSSAKCRTVGSVCCICPETVSGVSKICILTFTGAAGSILSIAALPSVSFSSGSTFSARISMSKKRVMFVSTPAFSSASFPICALA